MATFEHTFKIGFRDVGKSNQLTNHAILGFLEDTAGMHSDTVGYGLNDIEKTGLTWVLLYWKVQVLKRPLYGESILVKTWARDCLKFYTFRDFEMYNENNELVAIATTKWVLLDACSMRLCKISEELISKYYPETKRVFESESEINKIDLPSSMDLVHTYSIQRKDIDINQHVHNVTYLDIAYEALPEEIYQNQFTHFEILYKKETKLGEQLQCFYACRDSSHYICMKTKKDNVVHCIVRLTQR